MTARRRLVAGWMGALLVASTNLPAAAIAAPALESGPIPGLIAQFEDGQKPSSLSHVVSTRGLGNNLFALSFAHPTSTRSATQMAKLLAAQPGVLEVSLDSPVETTALAPAIRAVETVLVSKSVRASAPRSVRARDVATQSQRGTAQIKWRKPSNLAGGKLAFYEVSLSKNAGVSFISTQRVSGSLSKQTIPNLTPGRKYLARVSAVVKRGGKLYRGKSASVIFVSTTRPRPPVLTTPSYVFSSTVVSWLPQSKYQRGGLPVTYSVKISSGKDSQTVCSTAANSCSISVPASLIGYRINVSATNSRGSSSSETGPQAQDPLFNEQWSLTGDYGINAPNAWAINSGGPTVAVVDSGITEHADLEDSLIRASNGKPFGFDFVSDLDAAKDGDGWDDDPSDPGDFGPTADSSWHGTSVAGLISASRNSLGITGVAPNSRLVSVRAVGSKGGKISDLLAAVNWAAGVQVPNTPVNQHPARIINLSISSEVDFACEGAARSTFSDLRERGVVVVVAAGNRGLEAQKSFPASCSTVLVVAASTFDGQLAGYSNRGRRIDIAAPGGELNYLNPPWAQGLVTTSNSGLKAPEASSFRNANGTSLAAPLVSGVVALMLEVNPKLTPTDVKRILRSAVKPFAPSSFCRDLDVCGPGILDAAAAVELAAISGW